MYDCKAKLSPLISLYFLIKAAIFNSSQKKKTFHLTKLYLDNKNDPTIVYKRSIIFQTIDYESASECIADTGRLGNQPLYFENIKIDLTFD